jgi:hypothetical protein
MRSNPSETPLRGRGLSLWERISRDPHYLRARRKIQERYGLPLPFDIRLERKKWSEWVEADEKRAQAFIKDVHTLFKKFEVPDNWYSDFLADIAGLTPDEGE